MTKGRKKDEDDGSDSGAAEGDDSQKPKRKVKKGATKTKHAKGKSKKTMKEKKTKPGRNQAQYEPGSLEAAMAAMEKSEEEARNKMEVNLLSDEEQEEDSRFTVCPNFQTNEISCCKKKW